MVYQPHSLDKPTGPIRQAMEYGVWVIATVLGLGLLTKELQKIFDVPLGLGAILYLALLFSVCLLVAGWKWVSQREFGLLCEWLDPKDYNPPEETFVIVGISVGLGLLLLAAHYPVIFGSVYTVYICANFAASLHFQKQMILLLQKSRERLRREGVDLPEKRSIYSAALDNIEYYYIVRPHQLRFIFILLLAIFGLAAALYSAHEGSVAFTNAAYISYILSVFVLEEVVITRWRLRYYAKMQSLSTMVAELSRTYSTGN